MISAFWKSDTDPVSYSSKYVHVGDTKGKGGGAGEPRDDIVWDSRLAIQAKESLGSLGANNARRAH